MNRPSGGHRLSRETSPYLRAHAGNPVDWYPFGTEAQERARREHKPILLSIGYLACHWCHVMAHESFEDAEIAALMNRLYVNIKVDREERPDLDQIYQLAHTVLTGRAGGWPLTVILEPDTLAPFFAGTYFPKTARYGLPGLADVLTGVEAYFHSPRFAEEGVTQRVRAILESVAQSAPAPERGEPPDPVQLGRLNLAEHFDPVSGGFGAAPKFPRASALGFLTETAHVPHPPGPGPTPLTLLTTTLNGMAQGGIYDQLGGGFFRYSVDERWGIPHFEKMLVDNALLLPVYAEAWQLTGTRRYREVALETAAWLLGGMRAPVGGFYSSLDADSDTGEGGYYLWDAREIRSLLSDEEWRLVAPHYGLDAPANFAGRWHLAVCASAADLGVRLDLPEETVADHLARARQKLAAARARRTPPQIDDKILVSANGLAIWGLCRAGRILGQEHWIDAAEEAVLCIRNRLFPSGRLATSYCAGTCQGPGFLNDHAFLLAALLELLATRWNPLAYDLGGPIVQSLLEHFEDRERGGFWFTPDDRPPPLMRPKIWMDEAAPAANAVAARALSLWGHLTGSSACLEAAARTLEAARPYWNVDAGSHLALLASVWRLETPGRYLILRGDPREFPRWREALQSHLQSGDHLFAIPAGWDPGTGILSHCAPKGPICLYRCHGTSCSAPITSLAELDTLWADEAPA